MAQLQRKDSDDDLLAGWSGELEALLYSPEVEGAIKEVSPCYYQPVNLLTLNVYAFFPPRVTPPLIDPPCLLQVYPSSNPLDQKDFNPIDDINELFPSEQVNKFIISPKTTPTYAYIPVRF